MVKIIELPKLLELRQSWRYHHPITEAHLPHAGQKAKVLSAAMYHGGDQLYSLEGIPHLLWQEFCLESADDQARSAD